MEQLLVTPCSFGSHLTRLELDGEDTLRPLAPHLQKLPLLQHLRTSITYKVQQEEGAEGGTPVEQDAAPPDLSDICPHLVSLDLRVTTEDPLQPPTFLPHAWLACLLPEGLQQLKLYARHVDCAHLTHLTAVRQLSLEGWSIRHTSELLGMSRLQQLELDFKVVRGDLLPLASKMVGLYCTNDFPATTLSQLVELTALTWWPAAHPGAAPDVNPLLSLTSLRRLAVMDANGLSCRVLEGLASLSGMRSISLNVTFSAQALDLVGQVTQLTSLELSTLYAQPELQHSSKSHMVQQLTNLRRLTIDQAWLQACGSELASLQQLTQLVVIQDIEAPLLEPPALVALLSPQPASLQHVVYVTMQPQGRRYDVPGDSRVEVVPSPLPGVRVSCAYCCEPLEQKLWPHCLHPCPHLPGVFEVVPQVG
jgi:hypothetical protein